MVKVAKKLYTPEEYLALEEKAEYRSEYFRGEIFQMAGGMPEHNFIASNAITALGVALKGRPCRTFNSDQRIFINAKNFFTYADAGVVCGSLQFAAGRNDTIINPTLIVEVLSESTEKYDRTTKFGFYKGLKSFQTYILVDQYRIYLESYHKNEAGAWVYNAFDKLSDRLVIPSLEINIGLDEIYEKTEFSEENQAQE